MNWSAFFQGAPAGFSQGMDWTQRFNQSQQMNPLLVQHQQLQNQQLGQNIGQSGTNFNREGNAFNAFMRQYMPGQGSGQGQPGMPMPGQGMTPTAKPQSMPNMDNILAGPQANGPGNVFGQMAPFSYTPAEISGLYAPTGAAGVQQTRPGIGLPTGSYQGQGGPSAPWQNMGGW